MEFTSASSTTMVWSSSPAPMRLLVASVNMTPTASFTMLHQLLRLANGVMCHAEDLVSVLGGLKTARQMVSFCCFWGTGTKHARVDVLFRDVKEFYLLSP